MALETEDGDIKIAYASPDANVFVEGYDIYAMDANGEIIPVDSYYEKGLRESHTIGDFWDDVQIRRNGDKREGLIGG